MPKESCFEINMKNIFYEKNVNFNAVPFTLE